MTNKNIKNNSVVGSDYFNLYNLRSSKYKLDHYLKMFNINDYLIYKASSNFREVLVDDLLKFKYSSYMCFKIDKYKKYDIEKWINFLKMYKIGGRVKFLNKPFPSIDLMKKIRIIK